jgi:sortase (surface protein transpeptidase)
VGRRPRDVIVWVLAAVLFLSACGGQAATTAATSSAVTLTSSPASSAPASTTATAPTTATSAAAAATTTDTSVVSSTSQATTGSSSAAPTRAATAQPTPIPVIPVKLQIPAINVTAPVELVGLTPDGAMDVPKQWDDVGWYEYGPPPGQPGNAAMAGHLDSTTAPAVFWRLGSLKAGDKIIVTLSNSQTVTFVVKEKVSYAYNDAPIAQVFGPATTANLNLITCGGSWDAYTKNYSNRIVVFTTKA